MMLIVRFILFPFSWLYGIVGWIRNKLYDCNFFKVYTFSKPIISVGNLSAGGTGKTPMIVYLIDLLKANYNVAILSRGYKRKTKGFLMAEKNDNYLTLGDEPMQIALNFPSITVAVAENRAVGINKILLQKPSTDIILLDDAFQHRSVKPSLQVLITTYKNPFYNDFVLPTGYLRECRNGYKRADFIVVSKCPENLTIAEQEKIIKQIKPLPHQKVFFSYIHYQTLSPINKAAEITNFSPNNYAAVLIAGIAQPTDLINYLSKQFETLHNIVFGDHHIFTTQDIKKIVDSYNQIQGDNKIVITTAKDAVRLASFLENELHTIPLFVQNIKICFITNQLYKFNDELMQFLYNFAHSEKTSQKKNINKAK